MNYHQIGGIQKTYQTKQVHCATKDAIDLVQKFTDSSCVKFHLFESAKRRCDDRFIKKVLSSKEPVSARK